MEENSRRKFLKDSAAALTTLGMSNVLANTIVQALGKAAFAQSTLKVADEKKYIYFSLDGAPPRWFFDAPLTPGGTSDYYPKTNIIGTYLQKDGNDVQLINKTWKESKSGLFLPPVWGSNPATKDGAFSEIKDNLFFFRGLDTEIDNHEVTRLRNQAPTIGGISLAGVYAGKSNAPISGVVSGSIGNAFRSQALVTPVNVAHGNVTATNNSIVTAMAYVSGNKPVADLMLKQQLREFESYAKDNGLMDYGLKDTREKADQMIIDGVSKFTSQWTPVYNKYVGLVTEAITNSTNRTAFVSHNDIKNPCKDSTSNFRMSYSSVGAGYVNSKVEKINDLLSGTSTIPQLAAIFAATEILIKNNITSICTFSLPGTVMNSVSLGGTSKGNITTDQHFIGTYLSTYVTTHYYRAIISCLNSLAKELKTAKMWQNTLIQFGSEFGRRPRQDGSGSDHQVMASSGLLISGKFNSTRVVGNITTSRTNNYVGFAGLGAPVTKLFNGQNVRINDIVKSVSVFLNVTDVTANGLSLLGMSQSELEKKNVE